MKSSPVASLRAQKKEMESKLALAVRNSDHISAERLRSAIAQIESYLKSWGAVVR